MTAGWTLDRDEREALLGRFPPRYAEAVADHVTLPGGPMPATPKRGRIVGRAYDDAGVEAMVVEIDGTTDRPGGGTYHITWSLAEGRAAKESNEVIARFGWRPLDGGTVTLRPAEW